MEFALAIIVALFLLGILFAIKLGKEKSNSDVQSSNARISTVAVTLAPDIIKPVELTLVPAPVAKPVQTAVPITVPQVSRQHSSVQKAGVPTVIEGGTYLYEGRFRNTDAALQGRQGELRVLDEIVQRLDERWFVFRNVVLPGSTEDLDLVLIGPGGTWVLEVKSYTGEYKVENGSWYTKTRNGYWARVTRGPGAQVMENAKRLCNFFKQNGITSQIAVNRAVVVAQDTNIDVVSTGTDVWRFSELEGRLSRVVQRTYHRPDHVKRLAQAIIEGANQPAMVH